MSLAYSSFASFTSSLDSVNKFTITNEMSETLDTKYTPTEDLMIITFCLVNEKDPLVPIPMSVRGTKFITLHVRNLKKSKRDVENCWFNIMQTIESCFEAEHKIKKGLVTSYQQDIDCALCNRYDPSTNLSTQKHGYYSFYTEDYPDDPTIEPQVEKYILVFSINYTPTVLSLEKPADDPDENYIITKHIFNW